MEKNEIKKLLYKTNPIATFMYISKGVVYYTSPMEEEEDLTFEIPIDDMGSAPFYPKMEAKLLIRWLQ